RMTGNRFIQDAKAIVQQMAQIYRQPKPAQDILLTGKPGMAYLQVGIFLMKEAGYISEYDARIGEKIAWIMTGGDLTAATRVDEDFVLDLVCEAFLYVLGER